LAHAAPSAIPSVGRIVHFVIATKDKTALVHRPAIVTDDGGDKALAGLVSLKVFLTKRDKHIEGDAFEDAPYNPRGDRAGTWHWPERVEGIMALPEEEASREDPAGGEGKAGKPKKGKKAKAGEPAADEPPANALDRDPTAPSFEQPEA
jgi:hypothetical protein